MSDSRIEQRVRRACLLALAALGLIVWSMLQPKPLPVVVAMSMGQLLGTLSLALFAYAVIADLRERLARGRSGLLDASKPEPPPGDEGSKQG